MYCLFRKGKFVVVVVVRPSASFLGCFIDRNVDFHAVIVIGGDARATEGARRKSAKREHELGKWESGCGGQSRKNNVEGREHRSRSQYKNEYRGNLLLGLFLGPGELFNNNASFSQTSCMRVQ